MADPLSELRNEVYATMAAYTALTDLARVYDEAPQDNPTVRLPYVTLGPANYDIELVDCIEGGEIMLQVDVWSDQPGQALGTARARQNTQLDFGLTELRVRSRDNEIAQHREFASASKAESVDCRR